MLKGPILKKIASIFSLFDINVCEHYRNAFFFIFNWTIWCAHIHKNLPTLPLISFLATAQIHPNLAFLKFIFILLKIFKTYIPSEPCTILSLDILIYYHGITFEQLLTIIGDYAFKNKITVFLNVLTSHVKSTTQA